MNRGARVLFVARWSSYRGRSGRVTSPAPDLRVLIDGEEKDEAVRFDEVIPERESAVSMTGAE